MRANSEILCINVGSSSIKFASYSIFPALKITLHGELSGIGTTGAVFTSSTLDGQVQVKADNADKAGEWMMNWLENNLAFGDLSAVGHRIVHGMKHAKPEFITPELTRELKRISAYDPEHLPAEIKIIEALNERHPGLIQIACFDTSFHTSMPLVAQWLGIPRTFHEKGIRRYGFHGLSYTYLLQELEAVAGKPAANGRIIIAHLGNGASMAAIKDGKCIDTTMGFTPASGLTMSTRSGDIDPGVAWYLMAVEMLSAEQFKNLVNHESGLLGISESSSDMHDLENVRKVDSKAAEAIDFFCYQAKKWIGSFAAILGGIDILIFSGGIGENSAFVRSRICEGLNFLGLQIDEFNNDANSQTISQPTGSVCIRVMKTNEELIIARLIAEHLTLA